MRNGKRLAIGCVDLETARDHVRQQISRPSNHVLEITPVESPYLVGVSLELSRYQQEIEDSVRAR